MNSVWVVLHHRTRQDTVQCLRSLLKDPCRPRHIVVVDNGSDNDSVDQIASWAAGEGVRIERRPTAAPACGSGGSADARPGAEIVLIATGRNSGYAAGNNVGIRYALSGRSDFVLILNGDYLFRIGLLGLPYGLNRGKGRHYCADLYRRYNPFLVALIATNLRVARLAGRLTARAAWR